MIKFLRSAQECGAAELTARELTPARGGAKVQQAPNLTQVAGDNYASHFAPRSAA